MWDVEDPILSRQLAHRWWWGCQPYAPAALYSSATLFSAFGTHLCYRLSKPQDLVRLEGLGKLKKFNAIRIWTHDLLACSSVTSGNKIPKIMSLKQYLQKHPNTENILKSKASQLPSSILQNKTVSFKKLYGKLPGTRYPSIQNSHTTNTNFKQHVAFILNPSM
jgi:hypothetical protein